MVVTGAPHSSLKVSALGNSTGTTRLLIGLAATFGLFQSSPLSSAASLNGLGVVGLRWNQALLNARMALPVAVASAPGRRTFSSFRSCSIASSRGAT